ncbi:MAG: murein hydrolase activator EnvC [Acidimicrobiia bacterium]|jgi:peptidoglycan LD-endopeptidase LytH
MFRSRVQRWATLLLTIGLLGVVPVAASAQTQADVDKAERNRTIAEARKSHAYKDYQDVTNRLEEAVETHELLRSEREDLTYRITLMEEAVTRYQAEVAELEDRARSIVVNAYTSRQRNLVGSAFTSSSIQELITSQALIARATERDLESLDNLDAVSRQAARSSADLDVRRVDVAENEDAAAIIVEEIADLQEQQAAILAEADTNLRAAIDQLDQEIREKRREDDRIRRQQAEKSSSRPGAAGGAPPAATPGFMCPVQGRSSFIDSWGFARSGGRKHKGVDMMSPRNTPLVAVVDGRIKLSSNSLGGWTVHLYSDNNTVYYYAHLESQAANLTSGQRVSKGTVIGYVGNSGNARYTATHVHFEIRPNGKAVNPYPTVRSAC